LNAHKEGKKGRGGGRRKRNVSKGDRAVFVYPKAATRRRLKKKNHLGAGEGSSARGKWYLRSRRKGGKKSPGKEEGGGQDQRYLFSVGQPLLQLATQKTSERVKK